MWDLQIQGAVRENFATGQAEFAQLLAEPPPCAANAKVRELFLAVPGIGPSRADRLAHCWIAVAKTLAGLSDRQRTELGALLRHH